jgi:hypothetical protein
MRKELERMETIEKYLNNNLSPDERSVFEKKLQSDPELKKEVELQKELMQGIQRAGIKQSAQKGFKKYKFNRNLKNWGLGALAVAVIAAGSVFIYNSASKNGIKENAPLELPALNEQGEKLWSDADRYLPLQSFDLNAEKDTVIETKDGIVIAIPAHSFIDASGKPVKGTIQLELKEALKAADIIKAGLSTRSGEKLLETGGMFYINARQDNVSLGIDPANAPYAEIPAAEVKPGMQLFEGKRMADGTIDWQNPKPIVKDLIPVDILSLDFYPPHYLDSLKSWGYNIKDKKFTDSLYYSYASYFDYSEIIEIARQDSIAAYEAAIAAEAAARSVANGDTGNNLRSSSLSEQLGNEENRKGYGSDTIAYIIGINPAKIKAIWDQKFQNTLLATREFAERLPFIHRTCNEDVLEMYVNNLDKNLSTIDSMVAQSSGKQIESEASYFPGYPEFYQFANRGDGKVKNGNKNVELLKVYYQQKARLYTEVISRTVNEFWSTQDKKNTEAGNKQIEQQNRDAQRTAENFRKELDLNMDEAYRQLGKSRTPAIPPATYGFQVLTTGWKNVDAYVLESTVNRTTLDYTDPQTGKKAIIRYEPLIVNIENFKTYDRVLVYLLPDELNSFMRMENTNGAFRENLNELMICKLVCIAYKGEESFYFSQDNVKKGAMSVSLIKTGNTEIGNNVAKLSNLKQSKAMYDELAYHAFEKEEAKRQKQLIKLAELTAKVRPVIFPCMWYAVNADTAKYGGVNK